ncbi:MAG: M48 family metalloprotease, partial [Desulfoplanes sp.]|nr:M48 family metalloprotease [Desulfoplanes sp.]
RRCHVRRWLSRCAMVLFIFFITASSVLAPVSASCAALFGEFTISDEAELGRKFNVMFRAHFPLIEDPEVVDYIRDLTLSVVKVMPPMLFPITINVVRDTSMNAFATAAGYVFVFSGLILNLDNEAEVVGVIAHELAHVSQRHIAQSIEQSQIFNAVPWWECWPVFFWAHRAKVTPPEESCSGAWPEPSLLCSAIPVSTNGKPTTLV